MVKHKSKGEKMKRAKVKRRKKQKQQTLRELVARFAKRMGFAKRRTDFNLGHHQKFFVDGEPIGLDAILEMLVIGYEKTVLGWRILVSSSSGPRRLSLSMVAYRHARIVGRGICGFDQTLRPRFFSVPGRPIETNAAAAKLVAVA